MDNFSEKYKAESLDKDFSSDPKNWLEKKALEFSLHYLLAHADDGVILGKMMAEGLVLSSKVFSETGTGWSECSA